jgi:hypothetical protein
LVFILFDGVSGGFRTFTPSRWTAGGRHLMEKNRLGLSFLFVGLLCIREGIRLGDILRLLPQTFFFFFVFNGFFFKGILGETTK